MTGAILIVPADPRAASVRVLLEAHLALARAATPREHSFALDIEGLVQPGIAFFAARRDHEVVGVGAIKHLDPSHAEVKSMHTRHDLRGRGIGTAMLRHLLAFAAQRGYRRVSLETGTTPEFAGARALYTQAGFRPCAPFGHYAPSPHNAFFTINLEQPDEHLAGPEQ
ncbi:MAG: GNAT family N-acetyltransferase [Acidimicrobiales bacterium]|nr:GNAT family N-acetyltransferase [Acidimicrobiales bacterium]